MDYLMDYLIGYTGRNVGGLLKQQRGSNN